ncbi:monomethylamine:corrinoid methyltransferase [Methanohalophilus halophilus]|uniref:[methylamine--corrinoid protein] Co-methyltransferase n=1 Tax=Methanohalophilus halophilus TaxID=2177 RepID=A0A1L3Q2W7_9EURY|nr:monomethylamine:corrinoid methyltransferase [Methanohalophilus halophilus]APH39200.1 methyltransferase [Methanohalophilus halophilus]RNI09741.1 monomethylamine:corrinoid methyltransferase [Methanohalophilus halophilus]SDW55253.1 monomethylamine:corrinoid methyltransferase [Methanohalophilus halophilus]
MSDIYKYLRNSFSGEEKSENTHNEDVLKLSTELAADYDIINDGEEFIPYELDMADAVFSAAIELLTNVGIYCTDTGRTIQVNNDEILKSLGTPNAVDIGRFKEKINVVSRTEMDCKPPVIIGGPMGGKVSEKNFLNIHISSAIEPIVQGIYPGSMQTINDGPIRTNTPEEMFVALEEARLERLATKIAGREGLTLVGPATPNTSQAHMVVSSNELYSKNDIHEVYQSGNLKTDFETFHKSIFHQEHGNNFISGQCPVLGKDAIDSPEALAIIDVAETIQSRLVTSASIHACGAIDSATKSSSTKEILWASNISSLAVSRNMQHSTAKYYHNIAGCCTDMMFYETAAQAISDTVCGREMLIGPLGGRGEKVDHSTGLESRFMGEVSKMALNLDLAEANEIIEMLYSKYVDRLSDAPQGKDFESCYDVNSKYEMKPTEEYMNMYSEIIGEIDEYYRGLF